MEKLDLKDKKVIVFGLGVTGKSSIKALSKLGAKVYIYDDRPVEKYRDSLSDISEYDYEIISNYDELEWNEFEFLLKSPGIKNQNKFLLKAKENNLEVISDIEIAYRLWGGDNLIAVTGTNGKTTTTSLIAHILNYANIEARAVGNIGVSILWDMLNNDKNSIYVVEMSSFQLDAVEKFEAKTTVITNISEDHTDWHGSYDNYKRAKFNIFKNLKKDDVLILNGDDIELKSIESNSKILKFSLKEKSDAYLKKELIYFQNNGEYKSFNSEIIKLVGKHNIANVLSAILAVKDYNIDFDILIEAISNFNPIEHRIEFVKEIEGIKYYNDSKGTNIDSTKIALSSFNNNLILIAGGYDKNVEFDELFIDNTNIKQLILFGETRNKIANTAKKYNIPNIVIVEDLEEAINICKNTKLDIDTVLFSPASASWDMYKNYEERGNHFKKLVKE